MANASLRAALRCDAQLPSSGERPSTPARRRMLDDEESVPAGGFEESGDGGATEEVAAANRSAIRDVIDVDGVVPSPADASETGPSLRSGGRASRLALARAGEGSRGAGGTGSDGGEPRGTGSVGVASARQSRNAPQEPRTAPQATPGRSLERGRMVRPTPENDPVVRETSSRLLQWASLADTHQARVRQYEVEFWKKFAIPAACIVFVLIGAPIGIRFPRGGVGMVIMVSLAVFAVYYAGLIGGESLADEGILTPFWAMWGANLVFLMVGLWAVSRIGMESATSRGGGWEDLFHVLKRTAGWPLRRLGLAGRRV
jgi:hypothetical protein